MLYSPQKVTESRAQIQKIPIEGGGGRRGEVVGCELGNFFSNSSTNFKKGRPKLPREAIRLGQIASREGSVPVSLRKPITTCDFHGDPDPQFPLS